MIRTAFAFTVAVALCVASAARAADPVPPDHAANMAAGLKLYNAQVRGILTNNCVRCHGGEKVSNGLNLATRDRALKGGKRGSAIVPGDHTASRLYQQITHEIEPHMPFKRPKLADADIAAIARWIDLGAPYDKPLVDDPVAAEKLAPGTITAIDREHWAYQPLKRVDPPNVPGDWARTPIDRFILARQQAAGLKPNPPADRRTLIRRVYLDLVGLPPTPEDVDAFLADTSADAYEKLVDRLLDSPAYGERWARHWMDVARYGESDGYEQDYDRKHSYPYRDFLIRAFNEDMPYDRFVRWQIAGDELAPRDPMALTATGFLGAGAFPTQLTEKEFESARYGELDDMAQAIGASFLGLTLGCARCHDHKYDPLPVRDYYRFVANFTTTIRTEASIPAGSPEQLAKWDAEHQAKLDQAAAAIADYERDTLPKRVDTFLADVRAGKVSAGGAWYTLAITDTKSVNGTKLIAQPDGSLLVTGDAPAKDIYIFTARTEATAITAIRLEALADPSMPHHGPGLAGNGNFALGEVSVTAAPADGSAKPVAVKLAAARATHQQNATSLSIAASIDGDPISGWAVDGQIGKDQAAVFDFAEPVGYPGVAGGTTLTITLRFEHPNARHAMGRPRLSITAAPPPVQPTVGQPGPPAAVAAIIDRVRSGQPLDDASAAKLRDHVAATDPQLAALRAAAEQLKAAGPQRANLTAMITSENVRPRKHHADDRGFPHFYKQTFLLSRGDANNKVEPVEPGYLQILMRDGKDESHWRVDPPAGATTSFRRASLANWITDTQHGAGHLVARVIVNRLWHHHFGKGLAGNPIDFGVQGTPPTHPDLLDYLAADLIEHGWTLKRLHRLIVTSAVYTQSADSDPARLAADPDNALLWRWAPRRLEAEPIRDAMLAVAGQLDRTMYGPGTLDENMSRRSIYFFIKRSKLIPSMMLFDWPEHLVPIGSRSSTTIAPQALAFMNSPQVRRYASALADRVKQADDPILAAYRLALSRDPDLNEHRIAAAFIERQQAAYNDAKKPNARDLALIDFCQGVFALNDFIYID